MKNNYIFTLIMMLGFYAVSIAQAPSYIPSDGLLGWWPFDGNANDESGNNLNGTVNGAELTLDRFGNSNAAYYFDGNGSNLELPIQQQGISNYSISCWFNFPSSAPFGEYRGIVQASGPLPSSNLSGYSLSIQMSAAPTFGAQNRVSVGINGSGVFNGWISENTYNDDNWHHIVGVLTADSGSLTNSSQISMYIDGELMNPSATAVDYFSTEVPVIGVGNTKVGTTEHINPDRFYIGKIDDIAIWDRSLSNEEVVELYQLCNNNINITPSLITVATGDNAVLFASSSNPNTVFQWQTNPCNVGWISIQNNLTYSGVTSDTLSIANLQLSNHHQSFRAVATTGECTDTSAISIIEITDTCLVTINDTVLTAVTDTLVINTTVSGLQPPNNLNTILVYPNPTNEHITIDYGNFSSINGYTFTITNSVGQVVFTESVNQQTSIVNLSELGGNGIYFVTLFDPQSNAIHIRKIVLQ